MYARILPFNYYTDELPTSNTILFGGNGYTWQTVTNIVLTNTSGSSRTATISIDTSGAGTNETVLLSALPLAAGETVVIDLRQAFDYDIKGYASGAGVNAFISGTRQENLGS